MTSIGVAILTCNAAHHLPQLLPPLLASTVPARLLIIDSSSSDRTLQLADEYGVEHLVIPRCDFNHGTTREMARKALQTDIAVMMTHDAYPADHLLLERLTAPLLNGSADCSYARQIPGTPDADLFESWPRRFNYPETSQLRSLADVTQYGVYTFFCSNSCAAWRNSALDAVGGFPRTLTNEDYIACARLLKAGGTVAYAADAVVRHSHRYTLREEFKRNFDNGYIRAEHPWIQEAAGHADARGAAYFTGLIRQLAAEAPLLLPYAVMNTAVKYLGFKTGYHSLKAPRCFKKLCSGQGYYWKDQ